MHGAGAGDGVIFFDRYLLHLILPRPARPLIYKGGRGTRSLGGSSLDEKGRDRDEGRDHAACLNSFFSKRFDG